MASIEEVGKETKKKFSAIVDKVKTEFKKKPVFYTALGVVVIFALYKLFNSEDEVYAEEEEVVTNAYVPVGYDGYPYMSESMVEDYENMYGGGGYVSNGSTMSGTTSSGSVNNESSSYVEDSYIYDEKYYKEYIKDMEEQNSLLYGEMMELEEYTLRNTMNYTDEGEVYNGLGDLIYSPTTGYKVLFQGDAGYDTQIALETANNKAWRNEQLRQMQANSSAWSKATSQAEKDALHDANQDIAKKLGLTYNSSSGKWYEADGSEALFYSGSSGSSGSSSSKSSSSGSANKTYNGVSYDANTDYAQKIADAKSSGASQSVISALERQREAKKKGEGLDDYGNKVSSSSGSSSSKSSSSSSSKSGSSSSSSSSKPKQGTVTGRVTWSKTKNSDGSTTHTAKDSSGNVKASYTTK